MTDYACLHLKSQLLLEYLKIFSEITKRHQSYHSNQIFDGPLKPF